MKYVLGGVGVAIALFILLTLFGSPVQITLSVPTLLPPTLTHEQQLIAPYETARAELSKLPTPAR